MNTSLMRDLAALAECRRQVAGGIERLVAPAGETAGRGPDRRRRLADGLVAEVLRRAAAGEKATAIAVALGVKPKQVENLIARRRQSIAPPAAPPAAARTRQQPPTAADIEAAQAAQAALRAPADAIAIRSWAEANGLRLPPGDGLDRACLQVVNAARVRHGLTPFWLLAHRQGALPADELRRMRAAGAVPTLPPEPGDRSRGRASNFYGAKAPR